MKLVYNKGKFFARKVGSYEDRLANLDKTDPKYNDKKKYLEMKIQVDKYYAELNKANEDYNKVVNRIQPMIDDLENKIEKLHLGPNVS